MDCDVRFAGMDFLVTLNFNCFPKKERVADFVFIFSTRTSCALIYCGFLNIFFFYLIGIKTTIPARN